MTVIKVGFRGKNILLGRNIKDLSHIHRQIELRFPGQILHGCIISYKGTVLTKFDDIYDIAPECISGSVKLEVTEALPNMMQSSEKQEIQIQEETNILKSQEKQQEKNIQSESDSHFSNFDQNYSNLYRCFYCEGHEKNCKACLGKGQFSQDSKFIRQIDTIVRARTQKYLKEHGYSKIEVQKIPIIEKQSQVKVQVGQNKEEPFIMIEDLDHDQIELDRNQPITREFCIKTNEKLRLGEIAYIYDEDSGKTQQILFANGEKILTGPFVPQKFEKKFVRSFRLMRFNPMTGKKMFFGPRFGCTVTLKDKQKSTILTNLFRKEVESQKQCWNINKGTEYLVEKLGEMGINSSNYQDLMEAMEDIIRSL